MNIAICCLIKDTPEYLIKEFVKHHFEIGIKDIYFIVDNGSKFVEYEKSEHIKYIPINTALEYRDEFNEKILFEQYKDFNQLIVYNWFFNTYKDNYDWISFVDDDEHLYINLDELEKYNKYSALYIPWKVYYNPSIKSIHSLEDFKQVSIDNVYKSFFFYCCKSIINTHICGFLQSDHFADFCGVFPNFKTTQQFTPSLTNNDFYKSLISLEQCKNIFIKHYYIRSFEDWIYRVFNRGDNYQLQLNFTDYKIPNRGIKDYYNIIYGDSVSIEKAIEDIEQLGRYDVIEKIKEDPITYGYGLYITPEYYYKINFNGKLNELIDKYGSFFIDWYLKWFLKK